MTKTMWVIYSALFLCTSQLWLSAMGEQSDGIVSSTSKPFNVNPGVSTNTGKTVLPSSTKNYFFRAGSTNKQILKDVSSTTPMQNKYLSTSSPTQNKFTSKSTMTSKDKSNFVKSLGLMPGPVILNPEKMGEEDSSFWNNNQKNEGTKEDVQDNGNYEQEDGSWYQDTDVLKESADEENDPADDNENWNFLKDDDNDRKEENKEVNIADKFGDFWDEDTFAKGPDFKEEIVTVDVEKLQMKKTIKDEVSLISFYSWILLITVVMVMLIVFIRQKNVVTTYLSHFGTLRHGNDYEGHSKKCEEGKSLVHNVYT